jgi:hypothetical protein
VSLSTFLHNLKVNYGGNKRRLLVICRCLKIAWSFQNVVCTTLWKTPTTNNCLIKMKNTVLFRGNSFDLQTQDSQYFFWNICSKWLYQTKQNFYRLTNYHLSSLPLPLFITSPEVNGDSDIQRMYCDQVRFFKWMKFKFYFWYSNYYKQHSSSGHKWMCTHSN